MHRLAIVLLLAACGSKEAPAPVTTASGSGSGSAYEALGKKPANARRANPPPGIEANALAVGAKAPAVELVDSTGTAWTLATALTKHARVMLVFYRGDW